MFKNRKKGKKNKGQNNGGSGGGGGGNAISTTQKMKATVERLQKRRALMDKKSMNMKKEAVKLAKSGNKKAALLKLKQKKMYEKEALKLESVTLQMEQQMLSLESMYTNQEIVGVMSEGVKAQQTANKQVNVDDVAILQDEIQQNLDDSEEVTGILSEDMLGVEDDDDLLEEFNELTIEGLEEDIKQESSIEETLLPQVPTSKPKVKQAVEEDGDQDALRQLEAELL